MIRTCLFISILLVGAGCDSGPGQLFTLLSDDVDVEALAGVCDGGTPQLAVDLTLDGFDTGDVLDDDTFIGTSAAETGEADFLLLVTLQVDQDAQPDGRPYTVRLTRPAALAGLDAGADYTLDVPVVAADGVTTYRQLDVSIPDC